MAFSQGIVWLGLAMLFTQGAVFGYVKKEGLPWAGANREALRARRLERHRLRSERHRPPAVETPATPALPDPVSTAERALAGAVVRAETSGGRMDAGSVELVREVDRLLRPLLAQLRTREADPQVRHDLETLAGEHLPRTVDDYLVLPDDYAHEHRTSAGTTPATSCAASCCSSSRGAGSCATRSCPATSTGSSSRAASSRRSSAAATWTCEHGVGVELSKPGGPEDRPPQVAPPDRPVVRIAGGAVEQVGPDQLEPRLGTDLPVLGFVPDPAFQLLRYVGLGGWILLYVLWWPLGFIGMWAWIALNVAHENEVRRRKRLRRHYRRALRAGQVVLSVDPVQHPAPSGRGRSRHPRPHRPGTVRRPVRSRPRSPASTPAVASRTPSARSSTRSPTSSARCCAGSPSAGPTRRSGTTSRPSRPSTCPARSRTSSRCPTTSPAGTATPAG